MSRHPSRPALPSAQFVAERVLNTLERFLHVEAVSGIVLLVAAAAALIWANSPAAHSYHQLWHAPLSFGVGGFVVALPLHFWINDALMAIFFLVIGLEIRREIHEGALANLQLAALPLAAAVGGIIAPAMIYLGLNSDAALRQGWAVPTATDIAFAVGVLALLGKSIPGAVRVLLLALAIVDDIAAVLIIALFYSDGLNFWGLLIAGAGILLVLGLQRIGIRSAFAYVLPGAILWFGLLRLGVHPTLAGVVLGLLTPVVPQRSPERPLDRAARALNDVDQHSASSRADPRNLVEPLKQLKRAQRDLLPPVVRVQLALHPWVAYLIMPLFALANAGVSLGGLDFADQASRSVASGIAVALVAGKPLGILLASWLAVRLGFCKLAPELTWRGVLLVGCLGGIGFTMAIFIASLAFSDEHLLDAAKAGVLLASATAAVLGLALGKLPTKRPNASAQYRAGTALSSTPQERRG